MQPDHSLPHEAPYRDASGHVATDILQVWRRYRLLLVLAAFAGAALAVGLGRLLPAKYQAVAQLLVDPRDLQVLGNQVMPQAEAQNIGTTLVETQALVLSSEGLLGDVAGRLKLADDAEFNGSVRNPISERIEQLKCALGMCGEPQPVADRNAVVLDKLQRALNVYRIDRTYVVQTEVVARDRDKARRILEALIEAYLSYQSTSRAQVAKRASQELGTGIGDLKERVTAMEREVALYKEQNNLLSARGLSVSEQQLADINTQLINARVEAAQLQARLDSTPRRARDLDKVPEAMASQTLRELRVLMARANEQRARLSAQLLPSHPAMRAVADSGRQVRYEIDKELARITGSIKIDYARAKRKEAALSARLEELREQQSAANQASIKLRELQRKLNAARAVYAKAIGRVSEANEQVRLSTANIRVISKPHALNNRTFPPPMPLMAAAGFLFGLITASMLLYLANLMGSGRGRNRARAVET